MYPRIPLISIIKYDLNHDEDDFLDCFYFPDDSLRDDFLNYFLLEYGEFTPIYQQPEMLITHITALSKALKHTIDKLYATLSLEYNPIENYDRHENSTDTVESEKNVSGEMDNTLTYSGGETTTYSGGETTTYAGSETDSREPHQIEHKVSADNTGDYFPSSLDAENGDINTKTFNNRTDSTAYSNRNDSKQYNNRYDVTRGNNSNEEALNQTNTHAARIHGNVGVTTSQQMIESERQLVLFNFFDVVAGLYGEKLCILLY